MQYMALIYSSETADDVGFEELIAQYRAFETAAEQAGVVLGGQALQPVSTATSVKLRNGALEITDGPFAETKEQLGGYMLFDCDSLDEAISWAAKIPSARYGTIEVRPIMQID